MENLTPVWAETTLSSEDPILIRRNRDPFGWLANMSPWKIEALGTTWFHTEGLFQALRVSDLELREEIRQEKNPMKAKLFAKKHADRRTVLPLSDQDLDNMRFCLRLKVEQHPNIKKWLLETVGRDIIEDCTKRQRGTGLFWGAALWDDGLWHGQNWLGLLWQELRVVLALQEKDLTSNLFDEYFTPRGES